MKIVTWNVNSIRARLERATAWLKANEPDVCCLQELKVVDGQFPSDVFTELGYKAALHGQKTYNGVAVLSRGDITDIVRGMGDGADDPQSRLIDCRTSGIRVISAYFPNGGEVDSDKFSYKLDWMERLLVYLKNNCSPDDDLLVCGDTNVALSDRDVANPEQWENSVLCVSEVRERLNALLGWGLTDLHGHLKPDGGEYTWWDYRRLGFQRGDGLRIDHILATSSLVSKCQSVTIDREERKGTKPSDHAPVTAEFF